MMFGTCDATPLPKDESPVSSASSSPSPSPSQVRIHEEPVEVHTPTRRTTDELYGFESDLQRVLDIYRELRDITREQDKPLQQAAQGIETMTATVHSGERELEKADDEDAKTKKRNVAITASLVSGTLLTAVVIGAPLAIPVGIVSGVTGWMLWKK